MKTNLLLITILLLAVSCAKESSSDNTQSGADVEYTDMTFKATAEDVTKVLLQNDRVSLHWQAADRIKIFDGVSNDLPSFVASGSGSQVDFHGKVINSQGPFYALYPYQTDAKMEGTTIYATVPEIQHAVAGSVPSNAFLAVAKADAEGNLTFKTILAYIRFKLVDENASEIESITLSGNEKNGLVGGVTITYDSEGNITDTYDGEVGRQVSLVGDFENGKEYIFAVRGTHLYKGVTLSVLYKDGSRRYISNSSSFVDEQGKMVDLANNKGKILYLSELKVAEMKSTVPADRWVAWLHGYDIEIAGEIYNRQTYGPAKLISSANLSNSVLDKDCSVYFFDSTGGPCTMSTTNLNSGPRVFIGRFPDSENRLNPTGYFKLTSGSLVMYDLVCDLTNVVEGGKRSSYFIRTEKTGSDRDKLHIDKCRFDNLWSCFNYNVSSNTNYVVKNIRIVNSDFYADDKSDTILTLDNNNNNDDNDVTMYILDFRYLNSVMQKVEEVTVDNNIIYDSGSGKYVACRVLEMSTPDETTYIYNPAADWNAKMSFCNNTLYNMETPVGSFKCYKCASYKATNNLLYIGGGDGDGNSGSYKWNVAVAMLYQTHNAEQVDLRDCLLYGLPTGKTRLYAHSNSKNKPADNTLPLATENPFATVDPATGTFTPIPKYVSYGAQR